MALDIRHTGIPFSYRAPMGTDDFGQIDKNWRCFRKVGHNTDTDQGEDIVASDGNVVINSTALNLEIVSSSADDSLLGTGARTILLQGVDGDYEYREEIVELDGTTPVAITQEFMAINDCRVYTAGSTRTNAGTITVRVLAGGATQTVIQPSLGRNLDAYYVVPKNERLYVDQWSLSLNLNTGGAVSADFALMLLSDTGAITTEGFLHAHSYGGVYSETYSTAIFVPEKARIFVRCTEESGNNIDVSSTFVGARYRTSWDNINCPVTLRPIDIPTGLSATGLDGSVTLSWTDVADDETGYEVWRSTTSGSGFTLLASLNENVETYTDTDVTNDTAYFYMVRARKNYSLSDFSAEATATPTAVVYTDFALFQSSALGPGNTDGAFAYSTDGLATFTTDTFSTVGQSPLKQAYLKTNDTHYVLNGDGVTTHSIYSVLRNGTKTLVSSDPLWTDLLGTQDNEFILRIFDSAWEKTTDGVNWTAVTMPASTSRNSINPAVLFDGSYWFTASVNGAPRVLRSTDLTGSEWTEAASQPALVANAIGTDGITLYVAGAAGTVVNLEYTTDGTTWLVGTSGIPEDVTAGYTAFDINVDAAGYAYLVAINNNNLQPFLTAGTAGTLAPLVTANGAYSCSRIADDVIVVLLDITNLGVDGTVNQYIALSNGTGGLGTPVLAASNTTYFFDYAAGV